MTPDSRGCSACNGRGTRRRWFRSRPCAHCDGIGTVERCSDRYWRSPQPRCELDDGHPGRHRRAVGHSVTTGGLIESTSTTYETWA